MTTRCVHPTCETPGDPREWHPRADAVGHYRTTAADVELDRLGRERGVWPLPGEGSPDYRARIRAALD